MGEFGGRDGGVCNFSRESTFIFLCYIRVIKGLFCLGNILKTKWREKLYFRCYHPVWLIICLWIQMDLPKQSLKVNPESSENNQSESEIIFFWNENTKVTIKLIKCLIEQQQKVVIVHWWLNFFSLKWFLISVCPFLFLSGIETGVVGLGRTTRIAWSKPRISDFIYL